MMPTLGTSLRIDVNGSTPPCSVPAQWSPTYYFVGSNPSTLTFQFSRPVVSVVVYTYEHPTNCPGVQPTATAYDSTGAVIGSGAAEFSACSGGPAPLDFHSEGPTSKLVITPPSPLPVNPQHIVIDYSVPCPPTGDSVIYSPDVREGLVNALKASGREPTGKEIAGFIFRRPDGTYFTEIVPDPAATSCSHTPLPEPAPRSDSAVAVGEFHTHLHTDGEEYKAGTSCPKYQAALNMNGKAHEIGRAHV